MRDVHYRAAEGDLAGRTLTIRAVPFNRPALVSDFGGPKYLEAIDPHAFDAAEQAWVYENHGHLFGNDPVGITADVEPRWTPSTYEPCSPGRKPVMRP